MRGLIGVAGACGVVLAGCGGAAEVVRRDASREWHCPADHVAVASSNGIYTAQGCRRTQRWWCHEGRSGRTACAHEDHPLPMD